jgi:hypothetical protein
MMEAVKKAPHGVNAGERDLYDFYADLVQVKNALGYDADVGTPGFHRTATAIRCFVENVSRCAAEPTPDQKKTSP